MRVVPPVLLLVLLGTGAVAAQGPGEAVPGDPRTLADAGACLHEVGLAAHTACVVLYPHFSGPLARAPLNVQRPPWDRAPVAFPGYGVESFGNLNEVLMEAAGGFVDYGADTDGQRVHHVPGIAEDLRVSPLAPLRATWFASIDSGSVLPVDSLVDAGVAPCLTLRTTIESLDGDYRSHVFAAGAATRSIVTTPQPLGGVPLSPCPDAPPDDWIYVGQITTFQMDLEPVAAELRVPREERLVVRLEWFQYDAADLDKVYPVGFRLHVGATTPNRLVVPIEDAVRAGTPRLLYGDGKAYLDFHVQSPLGSYDVDPQSIAVKVLTPDGALITPPGMKPPIMRYSVDHDGFFQPLRVVVPWNINASGLPPGAYEVQVSAQNWQHTATAQSALSVLLGADGTVAGAQPAVLMGTPPDEDAQRSDQALPTLVAGALGFSAVLLLWLVTERRLL